MEDKSENLNTNTISEVSEDEGTLSSGEFDYDIISISNDSMSSVDKNVSDNSDIVDLTTDENCKPPPASTMKSSNKKGDENKLNSDCKIVEENQLNDNSNRENEAGTSGTCGTVATDTATTDDAGITADSTTTVTNTNSEQIRRLRKRGRNYRINISASSSSISGSSSATYLSSLTSLSTSSSDEMHENVIQPSALNRFLVDSDADGAYLSASSSDNISGILSVENEPDRDRSESAMNMSDDSSNSEDPPIEEIEKKINERLFSVPKPKCDWRIVPDLIYRQYGLTQRRRIRKSYFPYQFEQRTNSSLLMVERLKLLHKLTKHEGCVNSLNFNKTGQLLVSGSDDLQINVWNWSANKLLATYSSGHSSNIYQTKFIDTDNGMDIVSSARDGQVRRILVSPSGSPSSTLLFRNESATHKLALSQCAPQEILSASEDGRIIQCDLRSGNCNRILTIRTNGKRLPLYSIVTHPYNPLFCVAGRDQFVRVYDRRNLYNCLDMFCPEKLVNKKPFACYITCATYNYSGTEIIASYSDEEIYLFETANNEFGKYKHRYTGHCNSSTIKAVNFYGPNSEYILSGSDCGNCFFWDKKTERIVQWVAADQIGAVNCLEPHPCFPILATSGIDTDIKIWLPSNGKEPKFQGLRECAVKNYQNRNDFRNADIFDHRMLQFFVRQFMNNRFRRRRRQSPSNYGNNFSGYGSDDSSSGNSDGPNNIISNMPFSPLNAFATLFNEHVDDDEDETYGDADIESNNGETAAEVEYIDGVDAAVAYDDNANDNDNNETVTVDGGDGDIADDVDEIYRRHSEVEAIRRRRRRRQIESCTTS